MSCFGKIKTYSYGTGQGWICPDDGSRYDSYDVYCHVIANPALAWIKQGDAVKYDFNYEKRQGKSHYATNLAKIDSGLIHETMIPPEVVHLESGEDWLRDAVTNRVPKRGEDGWERPQTEATDISL